MGSSGVVVKYRQIDLTGSYWSEWSPTLSHVVPYTKCPSRVGRAASMNDSCKKLVECSSSRDPTTMEGRTEEDCLEMKKTAACYDLYESRCEDQTIIDSLQPTSGILKQRLETLCIQNKDQGRAKPNANSCHKLNQCSAMTIAATRNNKKDELCQSIEKALECFDLYLDNCNSPTIVASFRTTIGQLRQKLKTKCVQAHEQVARFSYLMSEPSACGRQFEACLTPQLLHASEHKNYTQLCNTAPGVLSCVERVLEEECRQVSNKVRYDLRSFIDRLRKSVEPNCRDAASPSSALSCLLLLVCLMLGQLGLRHTSG
ncbi:hypothetical protein RRG08_045806 [Elysia crispata]|uniref:Uncharacterized protein n=1 Tax=Elysia crispata TaxID=231223 RepID=A0AAE0YZT9_9GAST|nr:hypothetical protein RRG08_045806 [Elysia crispata]